MFNIGTFLLLNIGIDISPKKPISVRLWQILCCVIKSAGLLILCCTSVFLDGSQHNESRYWGDVYQHGHWSGLHGSNPLFNHQCTITNLTWMAQQETGPLQLKMKDILLLFDWCGYSPGRISHYFTFNNCTWHNMMSLRWLLWLRNSLKTMLLFSTKPAEETQGQNCWSIFLHSSDKYQLWPCSLTSLLKSSRD